MNKRTIALAGNPNVGKSTVFNSLTGLKQHTGNWAGKTVDTARGSYSYNGFEYTLVDIPGTYSLAARSEEEAVARDFICFGNADAVIVVCDATCLERNMNLVLQTMEVAKNVVVCVNLADEAKKRGIHVDPKKLAEILKTPVVITSARSGKGIDELVKAVADAIDNPTPHSVMRYSDDIEKAIDIVSKALMNSCGSNSRWIALKLLEDEEEFLNSAKQHMGVCLDNAEVSNAIIRARDHLESCGILKSDLPEKTVSAIYAHAHDICSQVVLGGGISQKRITADKLLTGKTGLPIMLILLALVFWITIAGANYPSELLSSALFKFGDVLNDFLVKIGASDFARGILIDGGYRVLAWVVSVMLPPMAIFFPLFTLLEDLGYLPRAAFNLDNCFKKCHACGKQALTICMGFGCNAVGVSGCRIIDSPRERLIAILTNSFVPCNGRFPTIIAISAVFFAGTASGTAAIASMSAAVLGVAATFLVSRILSATLLRGMPSAYVLEIPPLRAPQIGKVIVRSVFDRTVFVLLRAIKAAFPIGIVIWLLSNINTGGTSLLNHFTAFLDPLGRLMGMDGVILAAFILGLPANEIVLPIALMAYMSSGTLEGYASISELGSILSLNGWTHTTAICVLIFCVMHWPCATTLMTIKKETGSIKWTALSALIPTLLGAMICMVISFISKML